MDPITGMAIGGIGMGASMLMDYSRRRKAERALSRMGKRPKLSVPKEVMLSYKERKDRKDKYQGFTQAENAAAQARIARANAGIGQKMLNAGGSAQAVQTALMNQNANANVAMAAQSAQMNRSGQAADRNAYDILGGQVGGYQTQDEQMAGRQYDQQVAGYGNTIMQANQSQSNMFNTMAGLGFQGAMGGIGSGTEYDADKYDLVKKVV